MTIQTSITLTSGRLPESSNTLHPWLKSEPNSLASYLESEYKKLKLLSRISLVAVTIFSFVVTVTTIFITSKPMLLCATFLALTSPGLFYFSTEFSKQANIAKQSLDKISAIAQELNIIKQLPKDELESELKIFDFDPSTPQEGKLFLLARHRYLDTFQQTTKKNLRESFKCAEIHDITAKNFHRNVSWEIFTNIYLPSFLEKAFCHFVAKYPHNHFFPGNFIDCRIKNFLEFSFAEKFENDSKFLVYKDLSLEPINLWDFEDLTNTLSSKELYDRIFKKALSLDCNYKNSI